MLQAIKRGFSFGLTSGIITTLGLIIGLYSSKAPKLIILGGILTIAIADAFSDALGNHMSEEAGRKNASDKSIWSATISTFIAKFIFAMTFLVPILVFKNLTTAVIVSIIWGLLLITTFSYIIAKSRKKSPFHAILEHVVITIIVIVLTYFVGSFVNKFFSA